MEQNTMKAVRDAELEAEKTEKAAHQECTRILESAQQEALKIIDHALATEKSKATKAMDAARSQGDVLQQQAIETVKQDIAALHQAAVHKRAQAKQCVHAALI